ncbi:MAG: hypothetical protein HFE63_08795 [Clostridiales bacterium]|nr:hypothetical protein [Clostridiales bacterium]
MNRLVCQANELLTGRNFEYAVCGGQAIDLFLGYESRIHSDIDILSYWYCRDEIILYMKSLGFEVYEMLGGGKAHHITDISCQMKIKRNIFCCKDSCELVQLANTDEADIVYINFRHIGQRKLDFIEFLFNDHSETEFIYARNRNISRGLGDAILMSDGIPYLAPEICLLYKSTDTERAGYQQDYELAYEKMDVSQREWLNEALKIEFPNGHKWMTDINK